MNNEDDKDKSKKGNYYLTNNDLLEELRKYYETDNFTHRLGTYVNRMVEGIAHAPNFVNYTSYDGDMKGDAAFRVCKAIMDKKFKIVDPSDIGKLDLDKNGNVQYETDKDGEFLLDDDGNKIPKKIRQNNCFGYFSKIIWRAFQNRIKIEKKYGQDMEDYKNHVYHELEEEFPEICNTNNQTGENYEHDFN